MPRSLVLCAGVSTGDTQRGEAVVEHLEDLTDKTKEKIVREPVGCNVITQEIYMNVLICCGGVCRRSVS